MSKQDTHAKAARRNYTAQFKQDLVQRCQQPGASVSALALSHGINANVLFRWRREQLRAMGHLSQPSAAVLLPVEMATTPSGEAISVQAPGSSGVIEIHMAGAQVRLHGAVDQASVRCVLQTLRTFA